MLRGKQAKCITTYPTQCACFKIHIDAPCSPKTHQTGRTEGTVGEGKGPVDPQLERGRSISPTGRGQVHEEKSPQIAPSHPLTHLRGRIHPKNSGRNQK